MFLHCSPDITEIKTQYEMRHCPDLYILVTLKSSRVWDHVLLERPCWPLTHLIYACSSLSPCPAWTSRYSLQTSPPAPPCLWLLGLSSWRPQLELEEKRPGEASWFSFSPSFVSLCLSHESNSPKGHLQFSLLLGDLVLWLIHYFLFLLSGVGSSFPIILLSTPQHLLTLATNVLVQWLPLKGLELLPFSWLAADWCGACADFYHPFSLWVVKVGGTWFHHLVYVFYFLHQYHTSEKNLKYTSFSLRKKKQ